MNRFLALFESILIPIEWTLDNFDLYLDPRTAPASFLPWLANWFDIAADPAWSEEQRRLLLTEAHRLYALRGTPWAMRRTLEILTGREPEIVEFAAGDEPFTFTVRLPAGGRSVHRKLVERLIEMQKPAHTVYRLEMGREA
jgi:phage tail-like protein